MKYPKTIITDEGQELPNPKYEAYKEGMQEVVDYNNGICTEISHHPWASSCPRFICFKCLQVFLKENELER